MQWSDYWNALSGQQRIGLVAGAAAVVGTALVAVIWLLRDPYVALASGVDGARLDDMSRALEGAKLDYRINERGDTLSVPRSQLGKARTAAAAGAFDVPPSAGLELFKETDFSTTDFAQRINYQRALQGELTRTIQTIVGVRSARVHVILPDAGLFKRNAARATAAVSVTTQPGNALTRAQVLGIQRLVAASVPEIKLEDVVVLDESGASLTRANSAEGELSSAQLDLKRQADQYFESKLTRLLQDLVPEGIASLSVDTVLDDKQLRVTTEEPIAARTQRRDSEFAAGVLIKERQSHRGRAAGLMQTDGYDTDAESIDREYEYKVGNRIEQTLSTPGSIQRISVAVAIQGARAAITSDAIEKLVMHAVGVDRARGDSVTVLLLPGSATRSLPGSSDVVIHDSPQVSAAARERSFVTNEQAILFAMTVAVLIALGSWWARARRVRASQSGRLDDEAIIAKVRQWLAEGTGSGR